MKYIDHNQQQRNDISYFTSHLIQTPGHYFLYTVIKTFHHSFVFLLLLFLPHKGRFQFITSEYIFHFRIVFEKIENAAEVLPEHPLQLAEDPSKIYLDAELYLNIRFIFRFLGQQ